MFQWWNGGPGKFELPLFFIAHRAEFFFFLGQHLAADFKVSLQFFLLAGMFGDHLLGQLKQRSFVAFFGHLDQGAFLVFRQATELAQFAVADAHTGHGFQGFFAEGLQVID